MSKPTTIRIERELRTGQLHKRVAVDVTTDFNASSIALKALEKAWDRAENGAESTRESTRESEG